MGCWFSGLGLGFGLLARLLCCLGLLMVCGCGVSFLGGLVWFGVAGSLGLVFAVVCLMVLIAACGCVLE